MMQITKKEIIVKCCLCKDPVEIDKLYDHTIEHTRQEIIKRKLLLEIQK